MYEQNVRVYKLFLVSGIADIKTTNRNIWRELASQQIPSLRLRIELHFLSPSSRREQPVVFFYSGNIYVCIYLSNPNVPPPPWLQLIFDHNRKQT